MIGFYRKLRRKILFKNKIIKYLLYAIGEIILVVIGILIAVQLNNSNEEIKKQELLSSYKISLIQELKKDILTLDDLKSALSRKRNSILNYVHYYNGTNVNIDVLWNKFDSINSSKDIFYKNTYTIEDLITTGSLSLFSKEHKSAILRLKNIQERYLFHETQTIESILLYELELKKNTDLLYSNGYSPKEHIDIKNWKKNLNSPQFRILNNTIAESLKLYDFQESVYEKVKEETENLLKTLNASTPQK